MMGEYPTDNRREKCFRIVAWLLMLAAFASVYYPVFSELVRDWSSSDDNSHGFLVIPLAGYMLWQNRSTLSAQTVDGSWIGLLLALVSLFMFLFAKLGAVVSLLPVAMIMFIWSAVIFFYGFTIFRLCIFPLLFLLFMVPVPSQIYAALTNPLQFIVTKITVDIASMLGMIIYREGNVIHLPDMTFQVVQACSGLRSIMTMLTLGAIISYFTLRSPFMCLLLIAAGVPIAIAVNIFRVLSMVVAHNFFKLDLTEGVPHTILGLFVFLLGLVFFMLFQKGLARCER